MISLFLRDQLPTEQVLCVHNASHLVFSCDSFRRDHSPRAASPCCSMLHTLFDCRKKPADLIMLCGKKQVRISWKRAPHPRADDESTISRSVSFGQANRRLLPATSVLGRRVVCLSTIPDNFITKFTYDLDRDQGSPSLQQMVYTYYLYKIKEKRTDLQCSASLAPKRTAKNFYPST